MQRTIITPPGRFNVPAWRELWNSREVAVRLAQRDLIVRYRQTVLGITWVLLQPLVAAGIFTIVFGQIAGLPTEGVPGFVFMLTGTLAWNLLSGIISRTSGSLVSNQSLVSKVFFPRLLVPLSGVASVLVDFVVGLGLAVVLLFVFGINPGLPVLLVPVWILLILMMGLGVGVAAAAYMVKYRDVGYILPWALQVLLYASPVAYSLSSVPANLRWMFELNPVTWVMQAFRWSFLGTVTPPVWQIVALSIFAPLVCFIGIVIFQRFEREFADVI